MILSFAPFPSVRMSATGRELMARDTPARWRFPAAACIRSNRCTVLVCTPTYALHLAEVAEGLGLDLRASDIRITIHAGEPGASMPNIKRRIEDAWGARCF